MGRRFVSEVGTSALKLLAELKVRGKIRVNENYDNLLLLLERASLPLHHNDVKKMIEESKSGNVGSKRPIAFCNSWIGNAASNLPLERRDDGKVDSSSEGPVKKRRLSSEVISPDNGHCLLQPPYQPASRLNKGLVLILNNEFKEGTSMHRQGTAEDVKSLESLFNKPGYAETYELRIVENKTKAEMMSILSDTTAEYSRLLVFILTHGTKNGLVMYTEDNTEDILSLDNINDLLGNIMRGKPKVLIVQACQGDTDLELVEADSLNAAPGPSFDEEAMVDADGYPELPAPYGADILLGLATIKGFRSYRNKKAGSWYIRHVTQCLDEMAASHHILDILTEVHLRVTNKLGKAGSATPDEAGVNRIKRRVRQVPVLQSTLRRRLYL